MKTIYIVTSSFDINRIEVIEETKNFIKFKFKNEISTFEKISIYHSFHNTIEEAKKQAIKNIDERIAFLNKELNNSYAKKSKVILKES